MPLGFEAGGRIKAGEINIQHSVLGIAGLLSKSFLKQVIVAFLIASPIAWYFMNKWLDGFAYPTSVSWWIFAVAGMSALFIASITVSFHAIIAAIANPIESLRNSSPCE